jgi:hypothetical protein
MITITEILGTDSISASRLVLNDNFNVLKDEINSLETYLDPDAGTIDGLNGLDTSAIKVGPTGAPSLEINPTTFDINTDVVLDGLLTITGKLAINNTVILTSSATLDLDAASAGDTYVISSTTSPIVILMNIAKPGQEVSFVCAQQGTGTIGIKANVGVSYNFGSNTGLVSDEVVLNDVGSTVKFKYIEESTGVYVWYIISGNDYSVV